LGVAVGLGFFASRIFTTRTSPTQRIIRSIASEVRHSYGSSAIGAARQPGLIKVTLLGIATKYATNWVTNATTSPSASTGSVEQQHRTEHSSVLRQPEVTTQAVS